MASRRGSAVSTKEGKQHKLPADRYQRQAELSLRIEEGRVARPPLVKEEDISQPFPQDCFVQPRYDEPTTLTRADTFPSPLEIHPGQRVRGFSVVSRRFTQNSVAGVYVKPFAEPDNAQQAEIERVSTIPHRLESKPEDAEVAQSHIQRLASDAKDHDSFARRIYHRLRGRRAIKPGGLRGFEYISSLATAHANAVLSQTKDPLHKRRMMYVLEYFIGTNNILSCAPPKLFERVAGLKDYLEKSDSKPALRLIYTYNNEEAINYLSRAFGISDASTEGGERNFREWMQADRQSRKASNKAIRWRPAFDSARGTLCSAFGLDFGSVITPTQPLPTPTSMSDRPAGFVEINHRQRMSIYMQRSSTAAIPDPRVIRFNTGSNDLYEYTESDVIIIFEHSSVGIGEITNTASLLGLDIPQNPVEASQISTYAIENIVLQSLIGVIELWHTQIELLHEPHAELEDYIWSRPADSSRARDVWAMSQCLHTMLKLINRHARVVESVQKDFQVFSERAGEQIWLANVLDEFDQLAETIRVDYLEPLEHMIDLMYKSVSIRDSRQSLELNSSLWRLSWITFIFLPLTCLASAFGMNTDVFKQYPSIKWYFVALVPLMIVVFCFWFLFRQFAPGSGNDEFSKAEVAALRSSIKKRIL